MITQDEIVIAYQRLAETTEALYEANEIEITCRSKLANAKLCGLADGTIEGRNADLREAKARELLADEYEALYAAESSTRANNLEFELARIEVENVRARLRLAELVAGVKD
jgi:hypothetical protein